MNNYLDITKTYDDEKIKEFSNIIKNGGIGIFPTETVYAIGGNGLDASSVEKIYNAKNRNKKNPINLLVNSIEMVETVAKDISPIEYKLMETFFPGPFTIILKKKDIVPDIVTAGSNYVGVRMSSSEIVKAIFLTRTFISSHCPSSCCFCPDTILRFLCSAIFITADTNDL